VFVRRLVCVCVSLWLSLTHCLALQNLTTLLCTLVGRGGSRRSRPEDQDDQDDFQQHHNDGPVMKDYEPVNVGAQVDEPLPSVRGMCCDSSLFCVDGWKCFLTCGIRRLTCNNCFLSWKTKNTLHKQLDGKELGFFLSVSLLYVSI